MNSTANNNNPIINNKTSGNPFVTKTESTVNNNITDQIDQHLSSLSRVIDRVHSQTNLPLLMTNTPNSSMSSVSTNNSFLRMNINPALTDKNKDKDKYWE